MDNEDMKKHIVNSINKDIRIDGRKFDEYRDIKIETGTVKSAEGSAKVTIGETIVLAGVKMGMDSPYPDTPENGNFMVNVELLPLSNPEFESGPPSIEAIELARVTDRGIRESGAIDTKKLCIKKGKNVWSVLVDICTINDNGNLFDACAIATVAALKNAKLPELEEEDDALAINYKKKTKEGLPLEELPISVTVYRIGNKLVIDPLSEEEDTAEARLTVSSLADGTICALQKGEDEALSREEISTMVDLAIEKAAELRKKI